jgi:hypothetical protein
MGQRRVQVLWLQALLGSGLHGKLSVLIHRIPLIERFCLQRIATLAGFFLAVATADI